MAIDNQVRKKQIERNVEIEHICDAFVITGFGRGNLRNG